MMWLLIVALWLTASLVVGFALAWAISVNRTTAEQRSTAEMDRYRERRDALARATRTDDHCQEHRP